MKGFDIEPNGTKNLELTNPQPGQILILTYQCEPGPEQAELLIQPIDDLIVREIDHERVERDGMVHHTVRFRIERVGI